MTAKMRTGDSAAKSSSSRSGKEFASAKGAAAHILSAPKGARTVSHQKIKAAVDKVFRDRARTGA